MMCFGRTPLMVLALVVASAAAAQEAPPDPSNANDLSLGWELPPPDTCDPQGGLRSWPHGVDAPPLPFKPGDIFAVEQLPLLEAYFPPQLWAERERFFYEGMRLEIGPVQADYTPSDVWNATSERFKGEAKKRSPSSSGGWREPRS